jgi:mannose-1-phosphate guanylyltransferase
MTRSRTHSAGPGRVWAIVLAGGEGKRLAPLTRAVYGHQVAKQFAALGTSRSFLQETMDRIRPLIPPARTLVVVSQADAPLAADQLLGFPGVQIVLQPTNRGTTVGVLLPLAHVLAQDPDALVAIFPCDHRFRRERVFLEALRQALIVARTARRGVVLLGAAPESAAPDLGWILPGRASPERVRSRPVKRFVEKPSPDVCWDLLRQGALWNTLIIAARARCLWRAARRHAPQVALPMVRYAATLGTARSEQLLAEVYARLPASDLSRNILQHARGLRVVPLVDSGWCDCGTPERLFQTLGPLESERLRRAYEGPGRGAADHAGRHRQPLLA